MQPHSVASLRFSKEIAKKIIEPKAAAASGSDVTPVLFTMRNSETAMHVREVLLGEQFKDVLGRDFDLGFRAARQVVGGPQRAVLEGLGLPLPTKGSGKGRRSPKRESESRDGGTG